MVYPNNFSFVISCFIFSTWHATLPFDIKISFKVRVVVVSVARRTTTLSRGLMID